MNKNYIKDTQNIHNVLEQRNFITTVVRNTTTTKINL